MILKYLNKTESRTDPWVKTERFAGTRKRDKNTIDHVKNIITEDERD